MQITAKVNFGKDLGQNLGTVFEARDSDGQVLFGAGFMGLFNTHFRMDRWTLQFFVRHDDAGVYCDGHSGQRSADPGSARESDHR